MLDLPPLLLLLAVVVATGDGVGPACEMFQWEVILWKTYEHKNNDYASEFATENHINTPETKVPFLSASFEGKAADTDLLA